MEIRLSAVSPEQVPNLPSSHFVDTRIYTDGGIFEEERVKIFGKVWNFVCHESELAHAGSFRTATVAGYPLVVVRQNDGGVKAFYNICRHRQAQVVRVCSGQAKSFQCFYHLWTYGIDGKLVGVTLPEGYAGTGFDKADYGLREVRADRVAGMVFVCLSEETEPLREFLGNDIASVLEAHVPVEGFEVFHFHLAEIRTNWKLFFENNAERYHQALHWVTRSTGTWGKTSLPDGWTFTRNGHNYKPFEGARYGGEHANVGLDERREHLLPGHKPNSTASHHLFPDLLLVSQTTVLRIDHLIPLEPGRTLIEWRALGVKGEDPAVRAKRIKHHNQYWGYAGVQLPEDIIATESQWPMMATGAVRYSVIAREGDTFSDEPLRHYYREWSKRVRRPYWDPFGEVSTVGDSPLI